jgi:hypothetical protein
VPVVPFRVFEACCSCHRLSWHILSWNWLLVQSSALVEVSHLLVLRSRFAVGHSLGCAVFHSTGRAEDVKSSVHPFCEFRLPSESSNTFLVRQPQPANTSLGLSFPAALEASDVHRLQTLPRSASLRLQGLVTLLTLYSVRNRAGSISHRRRSWD